MAYRRAPLTSLQLATQGLSRDAAVGRLRDEAVTFQNLVNSDVAVQDSWFMKSGQALTELYWNGTTLAFVSGYGVNGASFSTVNGVSAVHLTLDGIPNRSSSSHVPFPQVTFGIYGTTDGQAYHPLVLHSITQALSVYFTAADAAGALVSLNTATTWYAYVNVQFGLASGLAL